MPNTLEAHGFASKPVSLAQHLTLACLMLTLVLSAGCGAEKKLGDAFLVLAIVMNIGAGMIVFAITTFAEVAARSARRTPTQGAMWVAFVFGSLALAAGVLVLIGVEVVRHEDEALWWIALWLMAGIALLVASLRAFLAAHAALTTTPLQMRQR